MNRLPGIIGWEVSDGAAQLYLQTADKNVLRETGNYQKNFAYKMTGTDSTRTYVLTGATHLRSVIDDPQKVNLSTAFGSSPANGAYLNIVCLSKDGGTMSDYRVDVKIQYFVELTDPVDENEN